jgi:hypothetical protein
VKLDDSFMKIHIRNGDYFLDIHSTLDHSVSLSDGQANMKKSANVQ